MFPWFLYHFLWFLSCIFPCFCVHFFICFPASHVFDPVIFSTLFSCIFPCFCSQFRSSFFKVQPAQIWLEALNIHKTSSPSQLQTWLASPLLSVRLVTRATCILVIAIDNNRYESCQSNSRVIGCSIWRLSKTTQTYILWFSDFESKSLLLLNFWPPLFFKKKGGQNAHFLGISYLEIETINKMNPSIQLFGTLLEYTSWWHRTTPTKHLVPVHSRNIATRLK